jgi:hypothetical protein
MTPAQLPDVTCMMISSPWSEIIIAVEPHMIWQRQMSQVLYQLLAHYFSTQKV